jgi:hypothetical protein
MGDLEDLAADLAYSASTICPDPESFDEKRRARSSRSARLNRDDFWTSSVGAETAEATIVGRGTLFANQTLLKDQDDESCQGL